MKQLLTVLLALGLVAGANAQGKVHMRGGFAPRARVVMAAPVYGYGYSPLYSPYYSPFYDPFYRPTVIERAPSGLQLRLDDIDNDYSYRISEARHDDALSKKERKEKIRELKHARESAKIDAKRNYYKHDDDGSK